MAFTQEITLLKSLQYLHPPMSYLIGAYWCDIDMMWHRSGSTLAQIMACCLMAPNHYLQQCRLLITKAQGHSSDGSFTRDAPAINNWNKFENYLFKFPFKSPRDQWVKAIMKVAFAFPWNGHMYQALEETPSLSMYNAKTMSQAKT